MKIKPKNFYGFTTTLPARTLQTEIGKAFVFLYPGSSPALKNRFLDSIGSDWLSQNVDVAARQIDLVLRQQPHGQAMAFWDLRLGDFPAALFEKFINSKDDAWHPGVVLNGKDEPDFLRLIQPTWPYRPDPEPNLPGLVNWKINLRAAFLKTRALRRLGNLDGGFETLEGAARDMGFRWLKHGAVLRQHPEMISSPQTYNENIPLRDRYRLVLNQYGKKWAGYVLFRRLLTSLRGFREMESFLAARRAGADPFSAIPQGACRRDFESQPLPTDIRVSIVLPTLGRYRYLQEVLTDLKAQTVRPFEVLIADANPLPDRKPDFYDAHKDLPLKVFWISPGGICAARNRCLAAARGDYLWFVDDDSRFDAKNLESHLKMLAAYGADISVGPAYTKDRTELHPEQREIACGIMDCGTTLCRRAVLQKTGGFDARFDQAVHFEDADLGIRMVKAGGLMLNNPSAKRFHYLAPVGGSRENRQNIHCWNRWSFLPRPIQSTYYLARRHFEKEAVWEAMFQAWILAGWIQAKDRRLTFLKELAAFPLSFIRLARSIYLGRKMFKQGPMIEVLP